MERIKYLLLRFLREEATPAEQAELEAWAAEGPANRELMQDLQDPALMAEALAKLDQLHRQEAWARVERHALEAREKTLDSVESYAAEHRRRILRWSVAAAVVLLVAGSAVWLQETRKNQKPAVAIASTPVHDALPGGNKAILTLSGGRQVILDSATEDTVLTEGAAIVAGAKGNWPIIPATRQTPRWSTIH